MLRENICYGKKMVSNDFIKINTVYNTYIYFQYTQIFNINYFQFIRALFSSDKVWNSKEESKFQVKRSHFHLILLSCKIISTMENIEHTKTVAKPYIYVCKKEYEIIT